MPKKMPTPFGGSGGGEATETTLPAAPRFSPGDMLLPTHSMVGVLQLRGIADPDKLGVAGRLDDKTTKYHPAYRLMPGCWIWNGGQINGYGVIRYRGKVHYVHRLVWIELMEWEMPEGRVVSRWCLNKTCWNPDHLVFGKPDRIAKMANLIAESGGVPAGYRSIPHAASYLEAAAALNRPVVDSGQDG